jgi:hypothetical protein
MTDDVNDFQLARRHRDYRCVRLRARHVHVSFVIRELHDLAAAVAVVAYCDVDVVMISLILASFSLALRAHALPVIYVPRIFVKNEKEEMIIIQIKMRMHKTTERTNKSHK